MTILLHLSLTAAVLAASAPPIRQHEVFDLALTAQNTYPNPFRDVSVAARFAAPSGKTFDVRAFHDGGNVWRIRFAPGEPGRWTYTASSSNPSDAGLHGVRGAFVCERSAIPGFIRVSRENPRAFAYDDGSPFYFLGDTSYGLFDQSPEAVERYVTARRRHHFNNTRVWLETGKTISPGNESYNLAVFRRYDQHFERLKAAEMNIELILFHNRDFVRGLTPRQMKDYVSYIVARYAAFRNLSLWCIANEVEVYPDNKYDSFRPDPDAYRWAAEIAGHIKAADPHRHPITVHHANMAFEGDIWNEHFRGKTDVIQQQKHGDVDQAPVQPISLAGRFDGAGTDGDAFGIERWVEHDRQFGVPVINGEFGYEYYIAGDGKRCPPLRLRFSTNWQRKGAWRVAISGGYVSAGYERTLKCPEIFEPGSEQEGPAQMGYLYRFMSALRFDRMEPLRGIVNAPNLCLALPGEVYAAYYVGRNRGGVDSDGTLALELSPFPGDFLAKWFDPRKGVFLAGMRTPGGAVRGFSAPTRADDWVLLVHRAAPVPRDDRKLDSAFRLIQQAVAAGMVPGAAALVAANGRIVRESAYGLSDVEDGIPFSTNTLSWIASITKPVTAAAVVALAEEGKLGLDDMVERYLPEFREQTAPDGRHYPITIRQILTHTAGLPQNPPDRTHVFNEYWTGRTIAGTIPPLARAQLDFVPGAAGRYSNAGFFVLGRIVEIVSGRPFDEYVKSRLLDRLGMKDTYFVTRLPAAEPRRIATVYRRTGGQRTVHYRFDPSVKIVNAMPDGGLFSTASDLLKFYQAFLDGGAGVLTRRSVEEMTSVQAPGRGLGWSLRHGGFSHGGSSGAYAWADPKRRLVGILFLQDNDFDRISRLRSTFVHAVREAYGDHTPSPGLEKPMGQPWTVRLGGRQDARVEVIIEAPSGTTSKLAPAWTGGEWTVQLALNEPGIWRIRTRSYPSDPLVDLDFAVEAVRPIPSPR